MNINLFYLFENRRPFLLLLKLPVAVVGAFAVVCDEARWKAEHLRNGCSSRRDYRQTDSGYVLIPTYLSFDLIGLIPA